MKIIVKILLSKKQINKKTLQISTGTVICFINFAANAVQEPPPAPAETASPGPAPAEPRFKSPLLQKMMNNNGDDGKPKFKSPLLQQMMGRLGKSPAGKQEETSNKQIEKEDEKKVEDNDVKQPEVTANQPESEEKRAEYEDTEEEEIPEEISADESSSESKSENSQEIVRPASEVAMEIEAAAVMKEDISSETIEDKQSATEIADEIEPTAVMKEEMSGAMEDERQEPEVVKESESTAVMKEEMSGATEDEKPDLVVAKEIETTAVMKEELSAATTEDETSSAGNTSEEEKLHESQHSISDNKDDSIDSGVEAEQLVNVQTNITDNVQTLTRVIESTTVESSSSQLIDFAMPEDSDKLPGIVEKESNNLLLLEGFSGTKEIVKSDTDSECVSPKEQSSVDDEKEIDTKEGYLGDKLGDSSSSSQAEALVDYNSAGISQTVSGEELSGGTESSEPLVDTKINGVHDLDLDADLDSPALMDARYYYYIIVIFAYQEINCLNMLDMKNNVPLRSCSYIIFIFDILLYNI